MCHSGGLADTVRGVRRCPLVSVRYSSRLLSTRRGECVTSSVLLVESLTANLIMLNQRVVYNALRSIFQRKLIEMWSDEFVIVIRFVHRRASKRMSSDATKA